MTKVGIRSGSAYIVVFAGSTLGEGRRRYRELEAECSRLRFVANYGQSQKDFLVVGKISQQLLFYASLPHTSEILGDMGSRNHTNVGDIFQL
jgi:hypothetical protein